MPPKRPRRPSGISGLDWLTTDDGSLTLWDQHLQETYHSGCGAVAESLVVYLVNSGVFHRLADGQSTRVFEVGLGTGTNFLLTAALAGHFRTPLEYWAVEKKPLAPAIYQSLDLARHLPRAVWMNQSSLMLPNSHSNLTEQPAQIIDRTLGPDAFHAIASVTEEFSRWIAELPSYDPTVDILPPASATDFAANIQTESIRHLTCSISEHVDFHLLVGDALSLVDSRIIERLASHFDSVYFDPFSPETNPELWTHDLLSVMHQLLHPPGKLTSYCVKGSVRRNLGDIGFEVHKANGPAGGKREVLQALKIPPPTSIL